MFVCNVHGCVCVCVCVCVQAPRAPRHYKAIANFNQLEQENSVSLTVDQEVEVIGINQYGWWWVRATNNVTGETEEGWAPASYLQVMQKPLPLQT